MVDGLWATMSERVGLFDRATVQLVSKISNLCDPDQPTSQTDGQTQTTYNLNTALCSVVHRVVKMDRFFGETSFLMW